MHKNKKNVHIHMYTYIQSYRHTYIYSHKYDGYHIIYIYVLNVSIKEFHLCTPHSHVYPHKQTHTRTLYSTQTQTHIHTWHTYTCNIVMQYILDISIEQYLRQVITISDLYIYSTVLR